MNLAIALAVVFTWAATAVYCYLANRRRSHDQAIWDQFRHAHADMDRDLDDLLR
jgi:hypothetical protein